MLKQALSLLNKFIPVNLAVKGLEKLDPRFKKFIGAAAGAGYGADEAVDYLRNRLSKSDQGGKTPTPQEESANIGVQRSFTPQKVAAGLAGAAIGGLGGAAAAAATENIGKPQQPQEQQPQQNAPSPENAIPGQAPPSQPNIGSQSNPNIQSAFQNFLSKHPELGKYLDQQINQGVIPRAAAQKAKQVRKFQPMIEDIESNVGLSLEDLIVRLFGGEEQKAEQQSSRSEQLLSVLQQLKAMKGRK
jgi:hypothetical protein